VFLSSQTITYPEKKIFFRHEHLYEKIDDNLIRSEVFPKNPLEASRKLLGSRVILCTLSMLAHQRIPSITLVAPVETVIVDEASQIEIGDYLPMFSLYNSKLKKVVFIGDQMQRE
jgi:superfamily I DNA and/or RNA helicase